MGLQWPAFIIDIIKDIVVSIISFGISPLTRAEFTNNEQAFLEYYDEVEICEKSARAYFKAAIQIRNRAMVDRSDMVISCIQHRSGGAYKTVKYAEKVGKTIINIAGEIKSDIWQKLFLSIRWNTWRNNRFIVQYCWEMRFERSCFHVRTENR